MSKSLQDVVRRERAKLELSMRQVAERSGGLLNATTVHAIENGTRKSFDEKTLAGLARGLSLPKSLIDKAAGQPVSDDPTPFVLPKKADRLTRKERDHILELIDLFLARRTR